MSTIKLEQEYVEKFISKVITKLVYFKNRRKQTYLAYLEALKTSPNFKKFKLYSKLKPYFEGQKKKAELINESFIKKKQEVHQIDSDLISEKMSALGKMVARCGGDLNVFENTYGYSYEECRSTIK